MEPITPTVIVTLAFTKLLETSVEKFTEVGLEKIKQLHQKIWNKLRGNPKAEQALTAVEHRSTGELDKVIAYLAAAMNEDQAFATEIQSLASEIQSHKLQDNSMNQTISDQGTGFQHRVEGGTVFQGGTHNHYT